MHWLGTACKTPWIKRANIISIYSGDCCTSNTMPTQRPPTIDPQAALRWQRLPPGPSPWLHEEVAQRMAQRLDWIKLQPASWADWEPLCGGVQGHALVAERYPKAECFAVETDPRRLLYARQAMASPWWRPSRWTAAATRFGPPADGSVHMLWSNMALHMSADPQALLAQWHRALAVDGFLMFSCLGPDTLRELRELYLSLGWPTPSHEFTDMHDWGDMLAASGFAEPVMDMERITLSFETPQRLLQELRGLGRNLQPQRFAGLRGRRWQQQLHQALSRGPLRLTLEVVYGHAIKPLPRLDMRAETILSLAQMRETLIHRKK